MTDRAKLLEVLRTASAGLPDVIERKMFGCEALFTPGGIFAMVWKAGRIAVKLPVEERYAALLAHRGAEAWKTGPKVMGHWVLVPPAFEEPTALLPWLTEAHAMSGTPKAKSKAAGKRGAAKSAAKTPAAKKPGPKKPEVKKQPAVKKPAAKKLGAKKPRK